MAGMLEYKCPCCDGAIQFDSTTQKMKCPYCDTEFEVDALKGYDEDLKDQKPSEMNWATPGGSWAEGETAGLHTYVCKSCGGEIVGDDTMAASACPFCGNPIVLTGQFAGDLRPDLIIPFKLDKKAAKAKLQEHLKGKTLLPKVFRSQNHIDEIKGVYVPSGCTTATPMPSCALPLPAPAFGRMTTTIIPRPATIPCAGTACWALTRFRWTAPPRWQTTDGIHRALCHAGRHPVPDCISGGLCGR